MSPFSFEIQVSHQIQRHLLQSLPAARGLQHCASWRSSDHETRPTQTATLAHSDTPTPSHRNEPTTHSHPRHAHRSQPEWLRALRSLIAVSATQSCTWRAKPHENGALSPILVRPHHYDLGI